LTRLSPPTGQVGEALERVLESETFARSGRARDLLRYLVGREQAGEAEALKGYAIALDVFGRDDEFDPSADAVVRVQASRLRDLLSQYYQGEGANDPLRIDIPRGSYVPVYTPLRIVETAKSGSLAEHGEDMPPGAAAFGAMAAAIPAASLPGAQPTNVMRHLRLFWVAMGAVILLLGFVAYRVGIFAPLAGAPALDEGPGSAASISDSLPAVYVNAESQEGDVGRVASIMRGALAGFDTLEFIARPYEKSGEGASGGTEFLFLISQVAGNEEVRVELQHAPTARSLVVRDIEPARGEDMVADLLTSVAPASGAIYAFIANNNLQTPLTDCLLMNDGYYRDPSEEQFIRAFECVNALEQQGMRSPLVYSELASLKLQGITSRYEYASDFTRERALDCARKAIQLGPTSPYAHRAYGYLLLRLGNESEAMGWMRKAYELNPYDLSMAASYAYGLIFSGSYVDAAPILDRAVRASSARPNWWDYSLFLVQFMLDDMEKAANATLALETTKRAHYLAARMIVAHEKGELKKADELRAEIAEEYPVFAADPRRYYLDARYPDDMTEKLVGAIRAAGLVSAS
jgi:tetratricopeptide (TPR) repeat protein